MYDKKRFNKVDDKKLLHKIGKQWAVIGLSSLLLIATPLVLPNAIHASTVKQATVKVQANPHQSALDEAHRTTGDTKNQSISDQAKQMHQDLLNHAAKNQDNSATTMQLGSWRHRRRNYRRNNRPIRKNYRKASYRKSRKQNRRDRNITKRRNKRSRGKRRNLKHRQSHCGKRQVRNVRANKHARRTPVRRRNRKTNRCRNKRTNTSDQAFTPSERAEIGSIRSQCRSLVARNKRIKKEVNNSDSDFKVQNHPSLVNKYRQLEMDWVNFYRNMYGLPEAQENSADDQIAQSYAERDSDPDDWSGSIPMSPQDDINGYFTDAADADNDGTAGHRNTVIDYSTNLGVGVASSDGGNSTTLYSDGHDGSKMSNNDYSPHYGAGMDYAVAYPKPGLFPYSDAKDANQWSLFTDGNLGQEQSSTTSDGNGTTTTTSDMAMTTYFSNSDGQIYPDVNVSVHDDTADVDVPTSNLVTDYDDSGNGLYYEVDKKYIKPDHSYTITVSGIHNYGSGTYSYTTKLYHLNDDNA